MKCNAEEGIVIKQMFMDSKENSPFGSTESEYQSCSWLINSWRTIVISGWESGD